MQLIEQIINDLVNDQTPLSSALNKTKVLASRIGQQELLAWANNELSGYNSFEGMPSYRKFRGNIHVDYMDGYNHVTGFPLTLDFDAETAELFETVRFGQGVQQLEQLASSGHELLRYEFTGKQRLILNQLFQRVNGPDYQLTGAGISVPANILQSTLSAIRQRLLDFMLELETRFGLETDLSILKSNSQIIQQYMNTTIHNTRDGSIINTGNNAQITAEINISKGSREKLQLALESQKVSKEDTAELLKVIDSEVPVSTTSFGEKVNAWIAKMVIKSLDGSWEIGIAAAGGVLATIISKYYGLA